jgi:hypothetical protein
MKSQLQNQIGASLTAGDVNFGVWLYDDDRDM